MMLQACLNGARAADTPASSTSTAATGIAVLTTRSAWSRMNPFRFPFMVSGPPPYQPG